MTTSLCSLHNNYVRFLGELQQLFCLPQRPDLDPDLGLRACATDPTGPCFKLLRALSWCEEPGCTGLELLDIGGGYIDVVCP